MRASEDVFDRRTMCGFSNLRFLELEDVQLEGNYEGLWVELKWLSWRRCSSVFKVSHSYSTNLVILDLSWSLIDENWGGWRPLIQMAVNLKVLDLTSCENLTRTPDFSRNRSLERLIMSHCRKLAEIGSSIGNLRRLKFLDLTYCYSLRGLPEEIGSLEDLEEIYISGRGQPFSLPNSIGSLKSLLTLRLEQLRIDHNPASMGALVSLNKRLVMSSRAVFSEDSKEKVTPESLGNLKFLVDLDPRNLGGKLPASVGRLLQLKELTVCGCKGIEEVSDSLQHLKSLVELDLSDTEVSNLPDSIGDLQELRVLRLSGCCEIIKLPESIGRLKKLIELDARNCKSLEEIPVEIGGISSLRKLVLSHSGIGSLPSTVDQLSLLEELELEGCWKLQQLPELPPSLRKLVLLHSSISSLPSTTNQLSLLEELDLGGCDRLQQIHELQNLTNLKKLVLRLSNHATTKLMFLSSLTRLETLILTFQPLHYAPSSLGQLNRDIVEVELPRLSNLKNLSSVRFTNLSMEDGGLVDNLGVEELERLEYVEIDNCSDKLIEAICLAKSLSDLSIRNCRSLPDMSHLRAVFSLGVEGCREMTQISGLEKLESLVLLQISDCESLERLGNLSKLKNLCNLQLFSCPALTCIEGIEEGFFLEHLYIDRCDSLQNVDALLRRSKFGEHNGQMFDGNENVLTEKVHGRDG